MRARHKLPPYNGVWIVLGKKFHTFNTVRDGKLHIEATCFTDGHQIHYSSRNGAVERHYRHNAWSAWRHCAEFDQLFRGLENDLH